MRKAIRSLVVVAAMGALFLAFVLTGCSKHPSEEQLTALEESKQAAMAAEEQLVAKKAEKEDLEKQLADKKQQVDDCKAEKEAVSERLASM
jgi:hypothetical protein